MAETERAALDSTLVVPVYYGPAYADRTEELAAEFGLVESVAVGEFRPLSALSERGWPDTVALVFADDVSAFPDQRMVAPASVILVTTDAEAATAAVDHGVLDVWHWSPADDGELLAAKLRQQFGSSAVESEDAGSESARETGGEDGATDEDGATASKRTGDAVVSLDGDGQIAYCNETMRKLLVDVEGSPVGDSVWAHLPDVVVEDLQAVVGRASETGVATTAEVGLDEQGQQFAVTAFPSTDGVAVHARAVSARQPRPGGRSLYEYLIKTVGDAVYILDDEGRFTFVNDALCEMTGYDRETLIGSSVHLIKDDHTVEEAEDALRDLLRDRHDGDEEGIGIAKLDVELVTRDGEHVPCTDRMTLRPMEKGGFTGTVGTLRDISRQKRRESILGGLLEAAGEMVTAETADEVADSVLQTAAGTLDIDLATIREHDPETDQLVPVASTAAVEQHLPDRPVYDVDEGPVGRAFAEGELVVDSEMTHLDDELPPVETSVYLPLGDSRVLTVGIPGGTEFDKDERRFVELLAATAAPVFERVEREEERRRYEAVVEAADDMLFTLADGEFTLVTESFAAALGRDREELRGTTIDEVVADEAVADAITAGVAETTTYETALSTADGDALPSRVTAAPIESEVGAGVVGTVRDISDLRSAQREATEQRRRFTELFETLADPVADILYTDDGAVVRSVNPAFAALAGTDDETLRDTALEEVRAQLPDGVAEALAPVAEPETAIERDVSARTPDGERHYLLKTVPYEGDGVARAFVILTDVTDVKQRETQLEVLYRLLRHNLRNRTTVIQATAEEVMLRADTEEFETLGERIYEASEDLADASNTARTIQNVLDGDGAPSPVPVAEVAEQLDDRLAAEFPERDVPVHVETDGVITASGDVVTAVLELVENALEHAAPDPTVEVELADCDGEVSVAVHDDGPGIPDDEWDVVAGDREITQLQHASGLGLWLVKWVADAHGGSLRRDREGDRSTVAIDLPR